MNGLDSRANGLTTVAPVPADATPDDHVEAVRALFWKFARLGVRMPIDHAFIVIEGGRS